MSSKTESPFFVIHSFLLLIAAIILFSGGVLVGEKLNSLTNDHELIKRGVKQYNPKTGELEWTSDTPL